MDGVDQSPPRPRRAAAQKAEQNLDELYERFGKPLSDNEPDSKLGSGRKAGSTPATTKQNPKSKRWVPVKNDTPTKRRRQSSLESSGVTPPRPVVQQGEDLSPPVKKRRGRPPKTAQQAEDEVGGAESLVVTLPVVYTPEKAKAAAERRREKASGGQDSQDLQRSDIERSAFPVAVAGVNRAGTEPLLAVNDEEPATARETQTLQYSHHDFQHEGKETAPAQTQQTLHSVREANTFYVTAEEAARVAVDQTQLERESMPERQPDFSSLGEVQLVIFDHSTRGKAQGGLPKSPVQFLEELISATEELSNNHASSLPDQHINTTDLLASSRSAVTLRRTPSHRDAGYPEQQIGAPHRQHWSRHISDTDNWSRQWRPPRGIKIERGSGSDPELPPASGGQHAAFKPLVPAPTIQHSYLNKYLDSNPSGSLTTTLDIDPHTGLVDFSDPRTWRTSTLLLQTHLKDALLLSTTHFTHLTSSPPNFDLLPLSHGYNAAHACLQAQLLTWTFLNPAQQKTVPALFKLERWHGGLEHWRYAPNCPEEYRPLEYRTLGTSCMSCSRCKRNNLKCMEDLGDVRQRCVKCVRSGEVCDRDLAPFRRWRLFI